MKRCFTYLLRSSRVLRTFVGQVPSTSNDPAPVRGFYSSIVYEDEFKSLDVPYMNITLLPFQKEGVGWMAERERYHVGGIMADHLGMGKTVQMIALCLVSDSFNQSFSVREDQRRMALVEGHKLLTVVSQMQKISVLSNCTRINQPAKALRDLQADIRDMMKLPKGDYTSIRQDVEKWLVLASKFYPSYEKRATAFLKVDERRDYDRIETTELRTLVVVPAALMLQWKAEIEAKVHKSRGLRVYMYHGGYKWISSTELEMYDFVLTTYDTLTSSASDAFVSDEDSNTFHFVRKKAGPLFHVLWKRIILDEAHMIRHSRTQRWRAVQELQGIHRWAVTATPLHNSIDDIQNLLHFSGLPRLPVVPGNSAGDLLNDPVLQQSIARSLQPAFLRRGPVMIRDGKREVLVQLPEKKEAVLSQPFDIQESHNYNSILTRSRSALAKSEYKDGVFHIFAMMTRLRQACCHPWISQGRAVKVSICGICSSESSGTIVTKCGHSFCHECLLLRFREAGDGDELAVRLPCPSCTTALSLTSVFKTHIQTSAERIAQYKKNEFELSTKLKMVLDAIRDMESCHPDDKMIIFSQFTSFMDVITVALEHFGVASLRIDGTMTLTNRNATIRYFQTNSSVKIILASKTATGVGLNLTAANHVLVVDPWWNPAIEEQAVHRCYRIGQKKPVFVTRFIISDSIEQYCYDICQKKKEFGDAVLRAATSGDSGAKAATSKLQELVARLKCVGEGNEEDGDKNTGCRNGGQGEQCANVSASPSNGRRRNHRALSDSPNHDITTMI